MEWIGEALSVITSALAIWQTAKAKKAKREADRLRHELESIRREAGHA
jgi:hypothetical protein